MSKPYTKRVTYEFEVDGDTWVLSELRQDGDGTLWCEVREARQHGQEGTHMVGVLVSRNDRWQWEGEDQPCSIIGEYAGEETADAILAYVNEHGHPEMKP